MTRFAENFTKLANTTSNRAHPGLRATLRNSVRYAARMVCLLLVITEPAAFAQFNAGVQGNVQDATGASVPGATITLTNMATKISQVATSDASGVFRFASLGPGDYTVAASAKGFSTAQTEITLTAGETRNVPLTVAVGQVASSVTVTSQAPFLDTSDSRNQQTLDQAALENLPLATRNPTALLTLTPGVTGLGAGTATNFNPENYIDASANGRGQNGNQYIVDGLDVTSSIRPGVLNLTPNVDSLAETTVQVNTYSCRLWPRQFYADRHDDQSPARTSFTDSRAGTTPTKA